MFSTMQDEPLSLARLLMHAGEAHGASTVATWTGTEARRRSYKDMAERASQLAHALRGLGVGSFDRVATFMWNNNEHMEVYTAVPAMGAVLHALNIRLAPEQLTFIANHAEDQVVFVDGSLVAAFAKLLPEMRTVRNRGRRLANESTSEPSTKTTWSSAWLAMKVNCSGARRMLSA